MYVRHLSAITPAAYVLIIKHKCWSLPTRARLHWTICVRARVPIFVCTCEYIEWKPCIICDSNTGKHFIFTYPEKDFSIAKTAMRFTVCSWFPKWKLTFLEDKPFQFMHSVSFPFARPWDHDIHFMHNISYNMQIAIKSTEKENKLEGVTWKPEVDKFAISIQHFHSLEELVMSLTTVYRSQRHFISEVFQ